MEREGELGDFQDACLWICRVKLFEPTRPQGDPSPKNGFVFWVHWPPTTTNSWTYLPAIIRASRIGRVKFPWRVRIMLWCYMGLSETKVPVIPWFIMVGPGIFEVATVNHATNDPTAPEECLSWASRTSYQELVIIKRASFLYPYGSKHCLRRYLTHLNPLNNAPNTS